MATDVAVIVVSYNTRDLLRACLASLRGSDVRPREVVVVDNASGDGSVAMVDAEFPEATVVALDRNEGFARANNLAVRRTSATTLLLLNPDATVAPDTIGRLGAALDALPGAAAVGPRILNPDGSFQSCGYRFPTLLTEVRQSKNVNRWLSTVLGPLLPAPAPDQTSDVDWCDGACMLVRREAFEAVGGLDEQYFLYGEELDWCFNARRLGWTIHVVPSARVWHHRGQSSAATGASAFTTALLVETRLRYYRKNHSLLVALAAAGVMGAGFLKQRRHDPAAPAKLEGIARWRRSLRRASGAPWSPQPR